MSYRYRDDISIADAAFDAWGNTEEEMFVSAADALMNVMVENLDSIHGKEHRTLHVESEARDMLLFHLLEELIFCKDTEGLLMRLSKVQLLRRNDHFILDAYVYGEKIDHTRHDLNVDVKAVTIHRFSAKQSSQGWKATVVLDV